MIVAGDGGAFPMEPVPGYRPFHHPPRSRRERWSTAVWGTLPFGVFMVGVSLVVGHRSLTYAAGYGLLMWAGFSVLNFLRSGRTSGK